MFLQKGNYKVLFLPIFMAGPRSSTRLLLLLLFFCFVFYYNNWFNCWESGLHFALNISGHLVLRKVSVISMYKIHVNGKQHHFGTFNSCNLMLHLISFSNKNFRLHSTECNHNIVCIKGWYFFFARSNICNLIFA